MKVSPALEQDARALASKLEKFYTGLIGCRVHIDVPHLRHARGNHVRVRVELAVPGEDIIVAHEIDRFGDARDREATSVRKADDVIDVDLGDARIAIARAFDSARRQLEDYARRQRGDVKSHPRASVPRAD
jgi:ribosome-associated translation inhibitor RaiA